jgi:hypothetical protein
VSAVDEILSSIDPAQLAAALGTDEETASRAAAAAIPTLITSLQANTGSADGEAGLLAALGQHADGLSGDRVDLNAVDIADGQKILAHALADDPTRLQAVSGLDGGLLAKLLPLLAPIVMSYLAGKLGMGGASGQAQGGSGDVLGDLLGGLLGGGAGGASAGGLGDILGQILGGQQSQAPAQPAGFPADPSGDAGSSSSGGVFTSPGNDTGIQIPTDDGGDQDDGRQQAPSRSGDVLGDLLGQILGR